MYQLYQQGNALYQQHKDFILIGLGVLTALLSYRERLWRVLAWASEGIKRCWNRPAVPLEGQSRNIVYNVMKGDAYDDQGVIYLGNLCYYPDGTIKRRYFAENAQGDGYEAMTADVPLQKHERKSLIAVHKTKLADLKAERQEALRKEAASDEAGQRNCFLDGTRCGKGQNTSRNAKLIIVDDPPTQGPHMKF